jgi:DNA-binding IclR family transcriptional regulator
LDKTAVKLLRLYEVLCQSDAPLGVSALAGRMALTKSNAHRILRTLVELGYAQQDANDLYAPTLKAWELGAQVMNRLDYARIARPHLQKLNKDIGESVYLATLRGTRVVYLDVLESRYPIRIAGVIGGSAPPHCSASGKLLLAYNPAAADEYLRMPLERYTPRTVVKLPQVRQTLSEIRGRGYSVNDGEWLEGVCGVSAPLHDATRLGVAAVGITALKERVNRQRLKEFTTQIIDVAARISRELGYRDSGRRA